MKHFGRIVLCDTGINTFIDTGFSDFDKVKSLMRVLCARGDAGPKHYQVLFDGVPVYEFEISARNLMEAGHE